MLHRSIHIQPKFKNIHLIENFRKKYDPLFELVPAHITIAFPFKSILGKDFLKNYLEKQLSNQKSFIISLNREVSFCDNKKFICARIAKGKQSIIKIHSLVYEDLLKQYKNESYPYSPHLTLGHLNTSFCNSGKIIEQANLLLQDNYFEYIVEKIICEIIKKNNSSTIEFSIQLS